MQLDFIGRVNNTRLPYSKSLLPLFEAIINSIHAIEDAKEKKGEIVVTVLRESPSATMFDDSGASRILGFRVEDNGIGFTEENYDSFRTSDTTRKATRGGKGVGRFIWLKAFSRVEVDSVFGGGGKWGRRRFSFSLKAEPIEGHSFESLPGKGHHRKTTVSLLGYGSNFAQRCPKGTRTLAGKLVEHCLEFFALGQAPRIVLQEETGEAVDLRVLFQDQLLLDSALRRFKIKGHEFAVRSLRIRASAATGHCISYCAHHRVVTEDAKLARSIPNLPSTIPPKDGEGPSVYFGYVSSKFLDESVNSERTDFDVLERDESEDGVFDLVRWNDIETAVVDAAKGYLEPFTSPVREQKIQVIERYVQTEGPQYRHLLQHRKDDIDALSPELDGPKLDFELYRISKDFELDVRRNGHAILEAEEKGEVSDLEDHRRRFDRYLEESNDIGKANLAKYVIHRRAILNLFEDRLKRKEDGKFSLEESVHKIIFPLRKVSDEVPYEQQNLWLLDEKLAYHYYLASDKTLSSLKVVDAKGAKEPDLIVFDAPFAFVEDEPPFTAVTIVEFKRPGREEFSDTENPILQVLQYVQRIRDGRAIDRTGRTMNISLAMPFYCYIVCDLTQRFQDCARAANLVKTPDNEGFFGFNSNYNAYIEVISFSKMVRDAKRRNAILFDKLNLPPRLPPVPTTAPSSEAASPPSLG